MNDPTPAPRPFASYTPADHARIAMAVNAWSLMEDAFRAVVPEAHDPTGALITAALGLQERAQWLLRQAVVASHEQGMTWQQIGDRLGVSRQSAHERFAPVVAGQRRALAAQLDILAADPDARCTECCDTAWWAPRLDAWRAQLGELPGGMTPAADPGELLARLSDPDTAVTRLNGLDARGPDAATPRCHFAADIVDDDAEPGDYLTCTLPDGHPGQHQLAVSNSYD
jgi:hypothetical protein